MTIGRSRGIEIQGQNGPLEIAGNHQRPAPAYLYSITITSQALSRWGRFKWEDNTPGTNTSTSITYHVYYPTGSSFALVPEDVLPGNSVGFSSEAQGSNQGLKGFECHSRVRISESNFRSRTCGSSRRGEFTQDIRMEIGVLQMDDRKLEVFSIWYLVSCIKKQTEKAILSHLIQYTIYNIRYTPRARSARGE